MRVFLDTNVLASAAATRGLCADVLREVFSYHELVISSLVLVELKRVLKRKFGLTDAPVEELILLLQQDAILAEPGPEFRENLHDRDDVPILSAAVSGEADVFITGDKELLNLRRVEKMEILSPRQFWEKLASSRRSQMKRREGEDTL